MKFTYNKKLYLIGYFIPLYTFSVTVLVQWSWYKLLPIYLIFAVAFSSKDFFRHNKNSGKLVFFLIFYMLTVTGYSYINYLLTGLFEQAILSGQSSIRAYGHMIVQLIFMLAAISQIYYFRVIIKDDNDVDAIVNGYISGNILSATLGSSIQILLYKLNILPEFFNYVDSAAGLFRISGFGGEPKQFASFALLALLILVANELTGSPININNARLKQTILLLVIVLSFSTSAWIGGAIGLSVTFIAVMSFRRIMKLVILFAVIICIPFVSDSVYEIINHRLLTRFASFETLLSFVPKDALVLYMLKSDWSLTLFGAGAGGLHYQAIGSSLISSLPEKVQRAGIIHAVFEKKAETSFSASSFLLEFISQYGLIGIILLISMIAMTIKGLSGSKYYKFTVILSLAVLFSNSLSSIYTYVYLSILGILCGNRYNNSFVSEPVTTEQWSHN